jgi:hypothetical protein
MEVDGLYNKVGRDSTKIADQFEEGFFEPVVEVYMTTDTTKPSLVADLVGETLGPHRIQRFTLGRIVVYDPRFKTEKGIGVGSTLGDLRRTYSVDDIGGLEDSPLSAAVRELGMSFALSYSPPAEWFKTHDQGLIPDSAKIEAVYLADPRRTP